MSDTFYKYLQLFKYLVIAFFMISVMSAANLPHQQTKRSADKKSRKNNQRKTKITIRGTSMAAHQAKMMVHYYVQYWKLEGLHIFVDFTTRLPKPFQGYTQYSENKTLQTQQVVIRINKRISEKQQWLTLAHEMIHVKQFSRGELIYHGGATYTWKHHHCQDARKIAYKKRGWEKEAFALEHKMLEKYQEAHKLVAQR